jgi:hypothetical protein
LVTFCHSTKFGWPPSSGADFFSTGPNNHSQKRKSCSSTSKWRSKATNLFVYQPAVKKCRWTVSFINHWCKYFLSAQNNYYNCNCV